MAYAIRSSNGPIEGVVHLPGSKSLSNRAVCMAALACGHSVISNLLLAGDTERLLAALRHLGIAWELDKPSRRIEISGCGGQLPAVEADVDCGDSGTLLRFATALCATASAGEYHLHGSRRLHERPMAPLLEALRRLGALIECLDREDHAPLIVRARGLRGGEVHLDAGQSSQFASALLLAAPAARGDVLLALDGRAVSRPYIEMTLQVMQSFGVAAVGDGGDRWIVPAPQAYQACAYAVEPDVSAACFFMAAAAICGGRVRLPGLPRSGLQGDTAFLGMLEQMGCRSGLLPGGGLEVWRDPAGPRLRGIEADCADVPDVVPALAAAALHAQGPTVIRGVEHLVHKESDRLAVLGAGLERMGAEIHHGTGELRIDPPPRPRPALLQTHGDHRMAMAFAVAGIGTPGVSIDDPDCVGKSFPEFFQALESLLGRSA